MDSNATQPQTSQHMSPCPAIHPRDLGAWTPERFVALLGGAVEHSPWVAQQAWAQRPFDGVEALACAMESAIAQATHAQQLALLNAHPELAGREAAAGTMTDASSSEQGRLGLFDLKSNELARLQSLNLVYRERFGFPLIVALRLHASLDSVFAEGERRLCHDSATEWSVALAQVGHVMRGRLHALFDTTTTTTSITPRSHGSLATPAFAVPH